MFLRPLALVVRWLRPSQKADGKAKEPACEIKDWPLAVVSTKMAHALASDGPTERVTEDPFVLPNANAEPHFSRVPTYIQHPD